jgi:hypothetical protein
LKIPNNQNISLDWYFIFKKGIVPVWTMLWNDPNMFLGHTPVVQTAHKWISVGGKLAMVQLIDITAKKNRSHFPLLLSGMDNQEGIAFAASKGFPHIKEASGAGIPAQPAAERWPETA